MVLEFTSTEPVTSMLSVVDKIHNTGFPLRQSPPNGNGQWYTPTSFAFLSMTGELLSWTFLFFFAKFFKTFFLISF